MGDVDDVPCYESHVYIVHVLSPCLLNVNVSKKTEELCRKGYACTSQVEHSLLMTRLLART